MTTPSGTQNLLTGNKERSIVCEWLISNPERKAQKVGNFLVVAELQATLATCKRGRTAALIFPSDFSRICSFGYNGQPSGDYSECSGNEGDCGCIHAETNALTKLRTEQSGLILLTLLSPCWYCAGSIRNSAQIGVVIYDKRYRDTRGIDLLEDGGIEVWSMAKLMKTLRS